MANITGNDIHQRIWRIFSFYSLQGDPLQPDVLQSYEFTRFARDCGILDKIRRAELDIILTYETSKSQSTKRKQAFRDLTYHAFLNILMKIAARLYPKSKSIEQSMQTFLEKDIFPNAKHRTRTDISGILADSKVASVLHRFESALFPIFHFYAFSSEREERVVGRKRSTSDTKSETTFHRHTKNNSMKEEMRHEDFVAFAKDFGLSNSSILSTQVLGDIFLGSIDYHGFYEVLPTLSFREFQQALVRCALVLGQYGPVGATNEEKVKSLCLVMWRAVHERGRLTQAIEAHHPKTISAGDLLAGIMLFNNRFTKMWNEDNYRDYLSEKVAPSVDALDVIQSMFTS